MDTPGPKIILQTSSVRIIHIPRVSSLPESAGKLDNILVEHRARDGMGELHWEKFIELSWTESQSAFGDLMHQMFNQLVGDVSHGMVVQTSLGTLPVVSRPRVKLAELVSGLIPMVFVPSVPSEHGNGVMPFDNRDGIVGLDVTPAMVAELHSIFPDWKLTSSQLTAALVRLLLRAAAQELARE
jgi:hypothetical protein